MHVASGGNVSLRIIRYANYSYAVPGSGLAVEPSVLTRPSAPAGGIIQIYKGIVFVGGDLILQAVVLCHRSAEQRQQAEADQQRQDD